MSEVAPTYNWDTVFAIPVPAVNSAIVLARSSPHGFAVAAGADAPAVTASFGDWQICLGGDGKNLRMTVPMPTVTVDTVSSTGVVATIEIKLEALPHTDAPNPPKGVLKKLVPKTATTNPVEDPIVLVIKVEATPPMGMMEEAVFNVVFTKWINENLGEFNHIFAIVNLDEDIDSDTQWAFCTPSYIDYAYLDADTLESSTFGLLCMTGRRTGATLTAQISPNAIPVGCTGGFLVSPIRYLTDLLAPAIEHCYGGLASDDVQVASDSSSIGLKPGVVVSLTKVSHEGTDYTPLLTALQINIVNDTMVITSQTQTEISPGITAVTNATHWYGIRLTRRADGSQSLQYFEMQPAKVEHMTEKSVGIEITEILLGIITAIGVVIAGVLTDGAAFVAAAVIIGALGGLAAATPAIIALANTDDSPNIDALVLNTTQPITWPGGKKFTLLFAGLNESLQLGGTLHFG